MSLYIPKLFGHILYRYGQKRSSCDDYHYYYFFFFTIFFFTFLLLLTWMGTMWGLEH